MGGREDRLGNPIRREGALPGQHAADSDLDRPDPLLRHCAVDALHEVPQTGLLHTE